MAKNKSKKLAEAPTQEQVNKSLDNGLTATKGDVVWVDADKKDAAEFVANEGGVFAMSQSPAEDTTIYSAGVDPYWTDGRSKGASLDDVLASEYKATADTLLAHNCPVRLITVPHLDEETLGELLMHFAFETILVAGILNINAFDQPAVEDGKVIARELLEKMMVKA